MIRIICAFACALAFACAAPAWARDRLLVQVSDGDPAKWSLALNNVRNAQSALGAANIDIEIVAYGPGLGMLKLDSPVANRIGEAIDAGVQVVACQNTMDAMKLVADDMLPRIGYVRAAVVEILRRQQEGYAYLRP